MACALLPDRQDGAGPESDGRRDRRPGPRARRRARPARQAVQHRPDGHGRAAAQLRRDDEGAADPGRRARLRAAAAAHHALDRRPAAGARAAGAASRSCRTWPSRCTRRPTRSAASWCRSTGSTASPRSSRPASGSRSKRRSRITFEYVLLAGVNDSPRGCAPAREAAGGREVEGQPDSAERRRRHPVRAAVGRRRSIASRRSSPTTASDRVGAQEPRPRHPRRLRPADRRGARPRQHWQSSIGRAQTASPLDASSTSTRHDAHPLVPRACPAGSCSFR